VGPDFPEAVMEAYGSTRMMSGSNFNEDAFSIMRLPCPIVMLADGSGNARGAAKRAIAFLTRLLTATDPLELLRFPTWELLFKNVDSYLAGGPETTLIAAAFIGEGVYGANCGDSRAYLVNPGDAYLNSVANDTKPRIGTGDAKISPLHTRLKPEELLLLASDGAWTQLDRLSIQRAQRRMTHLSDLPSLLLSHANRNGCADDMTIVAVRR
jgi:hypothetical protein